MKTIKILLLSFLLLAPLASIQAQQKNVADMSKEEMMALNYDDLLNMSFEDLIMVANKFGMSADELLEFFLNKDVTSASKRAEKSMNSPLSTTVISKEEILNSGALSIPEALRLVPGMIVREKTSGNFDVHIRGNDNIPPKNMFLYSEDQYSLVMIDGRPVYNYSFGGTFWETLPIDLGDVERIEVIRGPSSALYGPNAVAGAINIITKRTETKEIKTSVNAQYGTNNVQNANASVSFGASEKLKFRFSGNYAHQNRFTDKFYVFDMDRYFTKSEIDTMTDYWVPGRSKLPVNKDEAGNAKIPDPDLAINKYGINGAIFYDINKDINVELALGLQNSDVLTSTLGNSDIPLAERGSNTNYIDLRSKIHGFHFQANQMWGDQDVQKGSRGWYISPTIRNINLEYEKEFFGSLTLRPGVSYQQATYSDQKRLTAAETAAKLGFLNGKPELNAIAGFLRADYKAFEKLRLIAAVRADKYNVPDDVYFTYQFISTFDINKNNVVRAVYSRANRGAFIVDSYANYNWEVVSKNNAAKAPDMYPYTLGWSGNENLKMPVMDMFEIGYRTQPIKNIMIDLEAFHTITKDYNYFLPDSLTLNVDFLLPRKVESATGRVMYYNFDLRSKQTGVTAMISFVANKNLSFRVFGTVQQTKLEDFYSKTLWNCFGDMATTNQANIIKDGTLLQIAMTAQGAIAKLSAGETISENEQAALTAYQNMTAEEQLTLGGIVANGYKKTYSTSNKDIVNGKIIADSLIDVNHKATPSFYGGFSVDYTPSFLPKLHINSNIYFYSENTLLHTKFSEIGKYNVDGSQKANYNYNDYKSVYTVEPKAIVNLKVSYKFWKENSVFFNARNVIDKKREFAYMDEVKGMYLIGMNLNF